MVLIRWLGVLPAYLFLFPACASYALFDSRSKGALRAFRSRLGLRSGPLALYRHFYSYGMSLVDRFAFLLLRRPPFRFTYTNEEHIASAVARGKGVILLGAHVGNWEIAGNLLSQRLDARVNVVLLDAEREALREVYRPALQRRRVGAISIGDSGAMVEIVARLKAGEIVAFLGDRPVGERCERATFLGGEARFPVGPFAVAAATGAPVIPVFTLKTGIRSYAFRAWDPLELGDVQRPERDARVRASVCQYASLLERVAREHPYQWYNFYDFWAA
jgi:predicted LPLAT superfamily acyltransferase